MPNMMNKKPTREDLLQAAEAAAKSAETFLEAAENGMSDDTDGQQARSPGRGRTTTRDRQEQGGPVMGRTSTRDRQAGNGQGGGRQRDPNEPLAYEEFLASMEDVLERSRQNIDISETAGFVKLESRTNKHKVYIAKGKTSVNRIESTIPHTEIQGAEEADRKNGAIVSYLPSDPVVVAKAIEFLVNSKDQLHVRRGNQAGTTQEASNEAEQFQDSAPKEKGFLARFMGRNKG